MIDIFTDIDQLRPLKEGWHKLVKRQKLPLLSFDWICSCINAFYKEEDILIVVVRLDQMITAIAPLVAVPRGSFRYLEIIGSRLYEPSDFLYENEESLRQLVTGITRIKLPVDLMRIDSNSLVIKIMKKMTRKNGLLITLNTAKSNYIDTNVSWDRYYSTLSPQRRYNFRRHNKLASKHGPTLVEIISPGPEELKKYFEMAIAVEEAGWKGRSGTALTKKKRDRMFYYSFLKSACKKKIVRFFFYSISGEYAAMIICLEVFKKIWVLKMGYNEKWAKFSPGIHLTNESIKYTFQNNLESYEFLGIAENWQNIWPFHGRSYSTVAYFPYSTQGMRSFLGHLYKYITRKIINAVRIDKV